MREPNSEDSARCLDLRKRSKRGEWLSPENSHFCSKMMRQYPEWYNSTEAEVFNATVPFGSSARFKVNK